MAKVIIGLSGGVDSAVAAKLLIDAGHEVAGLFMRNWDSALNNDVLGNPNQPDAVCPQEQDYLDALGVAEKLGIKLYREDFVSEYWNEVFSYMIAEYKAGRTPNPDILCNRHIKFSAFLAAAKKLGADYIAMGHYVRRQGDALYKARDLGKDQSYFLCQITPDQIAACLFPLGELDKPAVRRIAKAEGFAIAEKKDSTGVCFIGERNFRAFLQNYIPAREGAMCKLSGEVVGRHVGVFYYTIGQRHGLALGGDGGAWYVLGKDVQKNILYVGQKADLGYLISDSCTVAGFNWQTSDRPLRCTAKFRYRQADVPVAVAYLADGKVKLTYPQGARAVTPGQAAVLYLDGKMLGGGFIEDVYYQGAKRQY